MAEMRKAGLLVWEVHHRVAEMIRPGVTTAEVDAEVEVMRQEAARSLAPFACRPGCASCCRFWCECGPLDALSVASSLIVQGLVTKGIRRKLERSAAMMRRHDHASYWQLGRYCALLDGAHECLVYHARPFACRSHHAILTSERCDKAGAESMISMRMEEAHARLCRDALKHLPEGWPAFDSLPEYTLRALDYISGLKRR